MQAFGRNRHGPKIGGIEAVPLWGSGRRVPIQKNVARAEVYLHAKFHLDPSNRLATVYERHRQDRQTGQPDRQTDRKTDRQTDRQRSPSDSLGQTVLQTVAQNDKNSSGDEIANVNFYAVRPEATQSR